MEKTTERERERERGEEKSASPVTTNYSVKNLKFPTETGVPNNSMAFFKFQKKKERKIVQITAN